MLPSRGMVYEYDFSRFDWNDVALAYNYSIQQRGETGVKHDKDNFIILCAECIPEVETVRQMIFEKRRLTKNDRVNCHIYSNMSPKQFTVDYHSDIDDVYIWQVKGNTTWFVEDDFVEGVELNSGQMIYIPHHVKHRPKVSMPRISVSFSIQYGAFNE